MLRCADCGTLAKCNQSNVATRYVSSHVNASVQCDECSVQYDAFMAIVLLFEGVV